MRWLRLVGSLKTLVSYAKEPCKRDYILQKRPKFFRSLLIIATLYVYHGVADVLMCFDATHPQVCHDAEWFASICCLFDARRMRKCAMMWISTHHIDILIHTDFKLSRLSKSRMMAHLWMSREWVSTHEAHLWMRLKLSRISKSFASSNNETHSRLIHKCAIMRSHVFHDWSIVSAMYSLSHLPRQEREYTCIIILFLLYYKTRRQRSTPIWCSKTHA